MASAASLQSKIPWKQKVSGLGREARPRIIANLRLLRSLLFSRALRTRHVVPQPVSLRWLRVDARCDVAQQSELVAGRGAAGDSHHRESNAVVNHPFKLINIDEQWWKDGLQKFDIIEGNPAVEVVEDVFFDPRFPCLYDSEGIRVENSVLRKGQGLRTSGASSPEVLPRPPHRIRATREVVWVGPLQQHFGHFLLEGISRLWFLREREQIALTLPENPFRAPPFRDDFLDGLGRSSRDFLFPRRPTWFSRVVVPAQSLTYRGSAHRAHRTVAQSVAHRLCGDLPERSDRPVYLTRQFLPAESRRSASEATLVRELERRDFLVVSPERIGLREQVKLFERHSLIVGMMGSAFHTLLLARRQPDRVGYLVRTDHLHDQYPVLDALNRTPSAYIGCLDVDVDSAKPGFTRDVVIDVEMALSAVESLR
jgi:hypothetical protein